MLSKKPVIIIGGGIGGLTLAAACHLAKIPALVFEKAPTYDFLKSDSQNRIGGGIGLWGPALMALRTLGLEQQLVKHGRFMQCAGYREGRSGEWLVKPDPTLDRFKSCLCLHRDDLQRALYHAVPEQSIRFESEFVRYEETQEGVKAIFRNGESVLGRLVVGADGIHSKVRSLLYPAPRFHSPSYSGYTYYRAVVENPEISSQPAWESWGSNRRFGMVPLSQPKLFWFAVHETEANSSKLPAKKLAELFGDFHSPVRDLIANTSDEDILQTDIYDIRPLPYWSRGRIALLGDAAHAVAPNLAQGAMLAIQDALELASNLRSPSSSHNIFVSLENYEKRRMRAAEMIYQWTRLVAKTGQAKGWISKWRDAGIKAVPEVIKSNLFLQLHRYLLGWTYTPPDLGQGLYVRILGQEFFQDLVQRGMHGLINFHTKSPKTTIAEGSVTINRGNLFSRFLTFPLLLPSAIQNGRVRAVIDAGEYNEYWQRTFSTQLHHQHQHHQHQHHQRPEYYFKTHQWIEGEELVETLGPFLRFYFRLVPLDSPRIGFRHVQTDVRFTFPSLSNVFFPSPEGKREVERKSKRGWKLPVRWLWPKAEAETEGTKEGWLFHVKVSAMGIGTVLEYRGEIEKVQVVER